MNPKRYSYIFGLVLFVISIVCCGLSESTSEDLLMEQNWEYVLQADGTARITGLKDAQTSSVLTIPDVIQGHPVTVVEGLRELQGLSEVIISDGVTELGEFAFACDTALTKVSLPNSLKKIGCSAFTECYSLKEIDLPNSLEVIEEEAFYSSEIEILMLPSSIKKIGAQAFYDTSLQNIVFPETELTVGDGAFANSKMKEFRVPDKHPTLDAYQGVLFNKKTKTLLAYPSNNERPQYEVPKGITAIAPFAFAGNRFLKNVTIPGTVVSIGESAFGFCDGLTDIYMSEGLISIGPYAFASNKSLQKMIIPSSVREIGENAFPDDTLILVYKNSYAEAYCQENEVSYVCIDGSSEEKSNQTESISRLISINASNFPDEVFRQYILSSGFDLDGDGFLNPKEISSAETMNCGNLNISDLQGIEFFTALEILNCDHNQLTYLDVTRNLRLAWLDCSFNQLSELYVNSTLSELNCKSNNLSDLDVNSNSALIRLDCANNQLTDLNLDINWALYELVCYGNQLTELDLSNCYALRDVKCFNNQIISLDVSECILLNHAIQNTERAYIYDYWGEDADNYLLCSVWRDDKVHLYVDHFVEVLAGEKKSISPSANCSLMEVELNSTYFPDIKFLECIRNSGFDINEDGKLSVAELSAVVSITCEGKGIVSLDGIEYFPCLLDLNCRSNQLTNVELTQNPFLQDLMCCDNQLKFLDLNKNSMLERLTCIGNQLTSLDLTNNTKLIDLECSDNQLVNLVLNSDVLNFINCYNNQLESLDVSNCLLLARFVKNEWVDDVPWIGIDEGVTIIAGEYTNAPGQ